MSNFNSKLKMRCTISRLPSNPASQMDDEGMYNPSFIDTYTDVHCFLMYLRLAGGKLLVDEAGQEIKNETICLFDVGIDIKIGDRVYCSTFYPYEFFVGSVNPIVNARTGVTHHIECIMDLEKKN